MPDPWPVIVRSKAGDYRKLVESTHPAKRTSFSGLAFYAAVSGELVYGCRREKRKEWMRSQDREEERMLEQITIT